MNRLYEQTYLYSGTSYCPSVNHTEFSSSKYTSQKTGWGKIIVTLAVTTLSSVMPLQANTNPQWTLGNNAACIQHKKATHCYNKQIIKNARDIFGLTISDLATVLGVTRPTVYSHLRGQQKPNGELAREMERLHRYVCYATKLNINNLSAYMKRPLFSGETLFDFMIKKRSIENQLIVIKNIQEEEHKIGKMIESNLALKKIRSNDVSPSPILYAE